MNNSDFQQRIGYHGDIKILLFRICKDFRIGKYISHKIVPFGYEDFNLILTTNKGNYFVKIFATFRDDKECKRYVDVIEKVLQMGVSHPALFNSPQGFFYQTKISGIKIRLCIMQNIEGDLFYDLKVTPSREEMIFLIKQAALINKIEMKPSFIYDNWAITNFLEQYEKKKKYLSKDNYDLITPLVTIYKSLAIPSLPYCFVHGDIIKTNVIKDKKNNIYILDFAVSNYYPRIQELAVLLCDLFFDPDKKESFPGIYRFVLNEYQKYIKLTPEEVMKLPQYIKLAHAMHVLCATFEKAVNHNMSAENEYFLNIGKIGLNYTSKLWSV